MSTLLRLRWFLVTYGRAAVLLFITFGIASTAAGAYVYANPPTDEVSEQVDVEDVRTSVITSAIVMNDTSLYEPGERLVNQPAYIQSETPELTYRIQTRVPDGKAVTVNQRLVLQLTASRNDRVFWESTSVILADEQTVTDGQAISTGTVNMTAVAREVRQRRSQIGDTGAFRSEIVLNTTYTTGRYDGQLTGSAPIVFTDRAYWVDGDISRSKTHSRTVTREVTGSPDLVTALSFVVLGVSSFLTAVSFVHLRRQDFTLEDIEMELMIERYDEWISEGQVVTDFDRSYVKIVSVEDLVDIAIDSEKRVIHDTDFDIYAVVDNDIVYYFAETGSYTEDWLNMSPT